MDKREQGQSIESFDALQECFRMSEKASDARSEVRRLQRMMREARAALKVAEAAEASAEKAYFDTPYAEAEVAA